jgi:YesN/AraC family two-component response regulator
MILPKLEEKDYLKSLGLLVVEDNDLDLSTIASFLQKKVKNIYTASDGEKGLATFTKNMSNIDIVITDIRMPFMNGITMVEKIRELNSHVKVIYVSAHNESKILLQAIEAGANGFIVKPLSIRVKLMSKLVELAEEIQKDKIIERYNETLQLVLDNVASIIVISDGKELLSCNQAFLDFFDVKKMEDFRKYHDCICDMFIEEEGLIKKSYSGDETWIDKSLDTKDPVVKMENKKGTEMAFRVETSPLFVEDTHPIYVVEFIEVKHLLV